MVPAWRRSSRRKSRSLRLSRLFCTSPSTLATSVASTPPRVKATRAGGPGVAATDAADVALTGGADGEAEGAAGRAEPNNDAADFAVAGATGGALRLRGPSWRDAGTGTSPAPAAVASVG